MRVCSLPSLFLSAIAAPPLSMSLAGQEDEGQAGRTRNLAFDPKTIEMKTLPLPDDPGRAAFTPCITNPYKDSLNEPFDVILAKVQRWFDFEEAHHLQMLATNVQYAEFYSQHDHQRFFPFDVMAPCGDLQCVGGECSDDPSKIMCGLNHLSQIDDCIIYSIGSHNHWEFEQDMLKKTKCQIHTFDCTGQAARFTKMPNSDRQYFHHICLGGTERKGLGAGKACKSVASLCGDTMTLGQIQTLLGHSKIDLLKMDIEGWEWPIFDIERTNTNMPMQVLMEVHYNAGRHGGTPGVVHDHAMSSAADIIRLQSHLLELGYVVANRDDNPWCAHCTELTLVRVSC